MDDTQITERIAALVEEEHRLDQHGDGQPASADDHRRRAEIEAALDQCWDLLRQRRARRDAGQDPDAATARSEQVVEHYQQ